MDTPQEVTLHFFDRGTQDFRTYGGGSDVYPTGTSFSDLDWSPKKLGAVTVAHKDFNITFSHTFMAMASSQDDIHSGVSGLVIHAGLNEAEYVMPKEAYEAYVKIVKNINTNGWQQYFPPWLPRIAKEDNIRYIKSDTMGYISNSQELLSYEQWQECMKDTHDSIFFHLYQDEILLTISIKKKWGIQSEQGTKQEQYMVRISFKTAAYVGRNNLDDGFAVEGAELRKMYEDTVERDAKHRLEAEQKLREQGYRIDESYVNPDFWEYMH